MSLNRTIDVINQAERQGTLDIPSEQAAHLAWLQQAAAKDGQRPTLEHIRVGQYGNEAWATDGFRIHAIHLPGFWLHKFTDRLVRFSQRILRSKAQVIGYNLGEDGLKFPNPKGGETARLLAAKPLAVLALDPKYVRQALQDANSPVLLKVYDNGPECHLVEIFAEEDGVQRYALVMGCTVTPRFIDRLSWRPEELNP